MSNYDSNELYNIEEEETPLYDLGEPGDTDIDDDEQSKESEEMAVKRKPVPLGVLFKTMLTPVEGWKALKRARFSNDDFAARCFYPLIALAAVMESAMFFYEANITLSDWVKSAMITFVSFFFGYFSAFPVGSLLLPKDSRDVLKTDIGRQFVMLAMSTLAIFWCFIEALPMLEPVLVFLPIWTIYIVVKGMKILRVPKDVENKTAGLLCTLVIGLPILWNWIMSEFLLK